MKKSISGLIGKDIEYSYSKEIHRKLGDNDYDIFSKNREECISIFKNKNFNYLNITIPYKEIAFKYADLVTENVKITNSCNVLYKKKDLVIADNTDIFGFKKLVDFYNLDFSNKNILILGSGGTSKTVYQYIKLYNYSRVDVVSRTPEGNNISYDEAKERKDINIIINTTPSPRPINIEDFVNLHTAIDLKYNPLHSDFLIDSKIKGLEAISGLYMLMAQGIKSQTFFNGLDFSDEDILNLYKKFILEKANIVLIGMPGSGKTEIGRVLANKLGLNFIDTDLEIEKEEGEKINKIIIEKGEEYFRNLEEKIIDRIKNHKGYVISLGGGSLDREVNTRNLIKNGVFLYIKRDILKLDTSNRPLSENLEKLYVKRKSIYNKYADYVIENNKDIESCIDKIYSIISPIS